MANAREGAPRRTKEEIREARAKQARRERARRRRRARAIRRVIGRSFLVLITVVVLAVAAVFGVATVLAYGPSGTLSDWLVMSTLETSAAKFVGYIYFSDEEMEAIKARNSVQMSDDEVDTSLVVIAPVEEKPETAGEVQQEQDIEIVPVTGPTYNGYMMIVKDPSRVSVGVSNNLGNQAGMRLAEIAEKYGAVGAVNAGGFLDDNGLGDGGTPIGPVISQGEVVWRRGGGDNNLVIGMTKDNKLTFGVMSATTAFENGVRDCVTFGPALVKNGEAVDISGAGSGLNPRTAIGQRGDGAMLLLVINGRKVNSLGASYADLIEVMLDFGAVNAANLDGGTSSFMYYEGELVNDKASLYGTRKLPTAWIVK
ncbi:MAG: phosphodiester glycosidase family protein [Clostridia bacterium]|nr:phosphodiester glycosidase family protein [Clostridia bacterium]MBQ4085224.1 phosphodiester glycosidase family protein [Clostridia bacterium]